MFDARLSHALGLETDDRSDRGYPRPHGIGQPSRTASVSHGLNIFLACFRTSPPRQKRGRLIMTAILETSSGEKLP